MPLVLLVPPRQSTFAVVRVRLTTDGASTSCGFCLCTLRHAQPLSTCRHTCGFSRTRIVGRLPPQLCESPLIPRWRQAARIPDMGHIVERCTGVASSYARWTSALAGAPFSRENAGFGDRSFTLNYAPISKPHAGLAPALTYQVAPIRQRTEGGGCAT